MASWLLDHGAQIEAMSKPQGSSLPGHTALMRAAQQGDIALITLFLDHGAAIDTPNELGETALMQAAVAYTPNYDVITTLLQRGPDVNKQNAQGQTALM